MKYGHFILYIYLELSVIVKCNGLGKTYFEKWFALMQDGQIWFALVQDGQCMRQWSSYNFEYMGLKDSGTRSILSKFLTKMMNLN